jgi:hypothetical protein
LCQAASHACRPAGDLFQPARGIFSQAQSGDLLVKRLKSGDKNQF